MATPIDRAKLLSIGYMATRSKNVVEGRRADGVRTKTTRDERGNETIEHATKDDRVDVKIKPNTVALKVMNG